MGRLLFAIVALTLAADVAAAQDAPRIFPGFEKVYKESKKREAEALRAIAAAEAEIAASDQLRLEGERQIADADAAIKSQQLSYLTLTQTFGAAQSAREARVEAGQLEAAARAWADAEARREKGVKTVMAAEANRARASERLASAQSRLGEARIAIARTLEDAPPNALAQPAALATTLAPAPIEEAALPPAPKEEAALPAPASAEPKSALDSQLLGGPEGDRP
jgi:hypothetical protein